MAAAAPSADLLARFATAMSAGRAADAASAWAALEEAHVLSQPWAGMHLRSHAAMVRLAARERDGREVAGQLVRLLLAAPGSWTGRYPRGNTGRARVSMWAPMPMDDELAELLGG